MMSWGAGEGFCLLILVLGQGYYETSVQLWFSHFSPILSDVVPQAKCVLFSDVKVVFTQSCSRN